MMCSEQAAGDRLATFKIALTQRDLSLLKSIRSCKKPFCQSTNCLATKY